MDNKGYGLLVDFEYCTGCQSCEVACKQEKGFPVEQEPWGIKVLRLGPWELPNGKWEFDFLPCPTDLCDLCADRVAEGKRTACEIHCLGQCLQYGKIEDLVKVMAEKSRKMYIFRQ